MDLFWLGHAGFRLRSGNTSVVMDPYGPEIGLRVPPQHAEASVVTVSGAGIGTDAVSSIHGDVPPVVLDGPGEYEISGLHMKGVRSPRAGTTEDDRLWNTMFLIETDGLVVCHLGNPARLLTAKEVEELGTPHILVVPVGSKAGITPADAVEMVNLISPRIIVPMLFAHPGNREDLRELSHFLQELGSKQPESQARLSVNRSNLPEEAQLALLQPLGALL